MPLMSLLITPSHFNTLKHPKHLEPPCKTLTFQKYFNSLNSKTQMSTRMTKPLVTKILSPPPVNPNSQ